MTGGRYLPNFTTGALVKRSGGFAAEKQPSAAPPETLLRSSNFSYVG